MPGDAFPARDSPPDPSPSSRSGAAGLWTTGLAPIALAICCAAALVAGGMYLYKRRKEARQEELDARAEQAAVAAERASAGPRREASRSRDPSVDDIELGSALSRGGSAEEVGSAHEAGGSGAPASNEAPPPYEEVNRTHKDVPGLPTGPWR